MRNKVYIKLRGDGVSGDGSIGNPYDGSSAVKFDSAMRGCPANTDIYIGPGIFYTSGYTETKNNIVPQNGWHIKGAGIDRTIIKPINMHSGFGTVRKIVFGVDSPYKVHNTRWENFTIDCDMDNQLTPSGIAMGGININGGGNVFRKIKVINFGSRKVGYESFGMGMGGSEWDYPFTGCTVDSCIITNPILTNAVDGITAIICGGFTWDKPAPPYQWLICPTIKNCYVNLSGYSEYNHAYSTIGTECLIENNVAEWCQECVYDDSTDIQSITVSNNTFRNVQYGIHYNYYNNTTRRLRTGIFINNDISFMPEKTHPTDSFYGFKFLGNVNASGDPFDYLLVSGNRITCADGGFKTGSATQDAYIASLYHVISGVVKDNVFNIYQTGDPYFTNRLSIGRTTGTVLENNYSEVGISVS